MTAVYVVGSNIAVNNMFHDKKWNVIKTMKAADLVVFTGGEDISPKLYNQPSMPNTRWNPQRDARDLLAYTMALRYEKPMAGICRGAQFINVMAGGNLWQEADFHRAQHVMWDLLDGEKYQVSSTHHQQMIPTDKAFVIATANMSIKKERRSSDGNVITKYCTEKHWDDVEVVVYDEEDIGLKALCFQPHPEYNICPDTRTLFFRYLEDWIL